MRKYHLTANALADIRAITKHIRVRQKSPQNAALVAERLKRQFDRLVDAPGIGHVRQELDDESLRVVTVTGLIVIYNPSAKPLAIVRVVHGSRNLATL